MEPINRLVLTNYSSKLLTNSVGPNRYATNVPGSKLDFFPIRPWYRHKATPSFADMLGAAQRASLLSGVFDPASNSNNLYNHLIPDDFRRSQANEGDG
jgi:hypothetical protein